MRISSETPASLYQQATSPSKESSASFQDQLRDALNNVNELQLASDKAVDQVASGDVDNLHQVLIATEKARLSMQMTVRVTNKMVEAYQELSRMQI